ncbi:MAG: protoheme IX farnesyltransferase [Bacteroidales bacterium]|nr:protoheme IX farnesyltransferase [Bacteroidales bacterium]
MSKVSLKSLLALIKYRVSIAVAFTAVTGYVVYTHSVDAKLLLMILGVFLLASGASALNEWQESEFDALMERTKMRPIPTGEMSSKVGLQISLIFILLGTACLYFFFGTITALLGLSNIVWYNLIYTKLKRVTPFAVVPGSMVGAIPVLIGWCGAGGNILDPTAIFIAFFMFIWQIPHFWLLMFKYGKQYEEAGFPTINQTINPKMLKLVIFSWIVATSFSSIIVPLFLVQISWAFFVAIFALNILFIAFFVKLSFGNVEELSFRKSFISINIYMMIFMIMLIAFHLYTA